MAHRRVSLALTLLGVALAVPLGRPAPPPCPVTLQTRDFFRVGEHFRVGRIVTIRLSPACARTGAAQVRFRSATGTQPDTPPGYFHLQGGEQITRVVPYSWWVEQRDRFLIPRRVSWP